MFQNRYLSKEVYEYELTRPIRSVQGRDYAGFRYELPSRNYFTDEIRRQLSRTFGEEEFFLLWEEFVIHSKTNTFLK